MNKEDSKYKNNNNSQANNMGRGRGGMRGGLVEKPKNFKASMKNLLKYLMPYKFSLILVILFAIMSASFAIIGPKILGNVTNNIFSAYRAGKIYDEIIYQFPDLDKTLFEKNKEEYFNKLAKNDSLNISSNDLNVVKNFNYSSRPSIDYNGILKLILLLVGIYLFSALFRYIQSWIMTGVSQKVSFNLRRDISLKINHLPLRYFDKRNHGEILSRVTNDVDTVSQTLNQSLSQSVTAVTTIIGIVTMMFVISWEMALVAIIILPVSFILIKLVVTRSQKYFVKQQVSLGKINGHVEEMLSGHAIMKAFNGEKKSVDAFNGINNELYESTWKSHFFSGLLMPIMVFVGNLAYAAVAVLGGWLMIIGKISIGDIQAFIQYMSQFMQPINQTASIANVLQSTAAAAERVFEFLFEKDELCDVKNPVKLSNFKGIVEFDKVVFSYDKEKTIIKGFSVKIKPGQRVAIVGPTGAGKTTIVNLLMRFYDVDSGSIKIDGVNINDMKRSDLRSLFAMVLQDTWLFTGSIKENIAYGKNDVSFEDIKKSSKAAYADHFIKSLPGDYNMKINEEADNISQGEKQLLTIARAMLANPQMLILDEATSSVDTRTEFLIQRAMEKLMKGRTSFVIAHRLSTIINSDIILVMKDGNIVEQGKHEELLDKKGFYASIYNSQFANNGQ